MTKLTCYHQKKDVVWSAVGNDGEALAVRQLRHQCGDCGRLLPNALPHSMASPATPQVNIEALRDWIKHDREQWDRGRVDRKKFEEQRQIEWRERYENYLRSAQWQVKRRLVFERSGGTCEGCRQAKATQVHHLTYDHLGNELLWELAAVCRECHERVHEDSIRNTSRQQHHSQIIGERSILRDVS